MIHQPEASQRPVHSATTAMLVVDMQKDRVDIGGPLFDARARASVVPTRRLLELARATGVRVVFITHAHREDGCDIGPSSERHPEERRAFVEGTPGARMCEELHPLPSEAVILKRRASAFFGTDLDILLRGLAIETVVMAGFSTSRSMLPSVYDALARDYRTIVVHDHRSESDVGDGGTDRMVLAVLDRTSAEVMSVDGFANLIMRERL